MNVFGKEIIHLSSVDSTNNFAATLLSNQLCQNGTAILADAQSFGRGQRGNTWQSENGKNLLLSFIFKPDNLSVQRQHELTWATSLSILKTLGKFNIHAEVKWPNDVLVYGKKIAGILIENQITGDSISSSVIGIGLNVNQTDFSSIQATSISNELNNQYSKELVFQELCDSMNVLFDQIVKNESDILKSEYENALFQKGKIGQYEDQLGTFDGKIIGVDVNGFLLVEVEKEIRTYGIKEIRYCSK
jgi:BirA family biotin operon repressor/biotin-[acetyl-CoA-carboxylase] ligase